MLMNSKFNKAKPGDDYLIATGGHSGVVKLNHSPTDPVLEGLEIDW